MNSPLRFSVSTLLFVFVGALSFAAEPAKSTTTPAPDLAAMAAGALKASGLTASQLLAGTKTGLGALIDLATADVSKPGAVTVATPPAMTKLEGLAKKLNQTVA